MSRSTRMFEIIQLLRSTDSPLTASAMAITLEVTKRTVYRDIAALQAMRVPIEGEAGIGYIMRPGFDLPPLMFTAEEIEAIVVGIALLGRTGDTALQKAAIGVSAKINDVLPENVARKIDGLPLYASRWNKIPQAKIDLPGLRKAVRDEQKLKLVYSDGNARRTTRTVLPLAILYYIEVVVLAAWCEKRSAFRHFRIDRILSAKPAGVSFKGQGDGLRQTWRATHNIP